MGNTCHNYISCLPSLKRQGKGQSIYQANYNYNIVWLSGSLLGVCNPPLLSHQLCNLEMPRYQANCKYCGGLEVSNGAYKPPMLCHQLKIQGKAWIQANFIQLIVIVWKFRRVHNPPLLSHQLSSLKRHRKGLSTFRLTIVCGSLEVDYRVPLLCISCATCKDRGKALDTRLAISS